MKSFVGLFLCQYLPNSDNGKKRVYFNNPMWPGNLLYFFALFFDSLCYCLSDEHRYHRRLNSSSTVFFFGGGGGLNAFSNIMKTSQCSV